MAYVDGFVLAVPRRKLTEYRRVARTLLRRAMNECAHAGLSSMTLLVAEGNSSARHLYDTHGFQRTATFTIAAT